MKSGELKQRITIQQPTYTKNAIGEKIATWATWATVWAAVEPNWGGTYYRAKQSDSDVTGRIRIRYINGLKPTMRVSYQGRIFTIVSIIHPKENRKEIHIMYSEGLD